VKQDYAHAIKQLKEKDAEILNLKGFFVFLNVVSISCSEYSSAVCRNPEIRWLCNI
jgi:hypothetical protein